MNSYYWHGDFMKKKLSNLTSVSKITIAAAFFSDYGLELLREMVQANKLNRNCVEVYLSPEFSSSNPALLLLELTEVGNVYLVTEIPFHAKVYMFEGEELNQVIFGSSNFTMGGIEKNIEFNSVEELDAKKYEKLKMFFEFCKSKSVKVDKEIIANYESIETDLSTLRKTQFELRKKLFSFHKKDDPFDRETYHLDGYFFDFEDYEVFFPRNQQRNDLAINQKRKQIQEKMKLIHNQVYKNIKKLGLNSHWREENLTSLTYPCVFNKNNVGWLGIRYGKSEPEVLALNYGTTREEGGYGFQKHACLQFSIVQKGIEISLFHAVAHDAIDRSYLHKRIQDKNFVQLLTQEINKLKGNGLVWYIHSSSESVKFHLDEQPAEAFIDFYKTYDEDGKESLLSFFMSADCELIKDVQGISSIVLEKIKIMLPLYERIVYRVPV